MANWIKKECYQANYMKLMNDEFMLNANHKIEKYIFIKENTLQNNICIRQTIKYSVVLFPCSPTV